MKSQSVCSSTGCTEGISTFCGHLAVYGQIAWLLTWGWSGGSQAGARMELAHVRGAGVRPQSLGQGKGVRVVGRAGGTSSLAPRSSGIKQGRGALHAWPGAERRGH